MNPPSESTAATRLQRYDLVLTDGSYLWGRLLAGDPGDFRCEGREVRHALKVGVLHRLPWLGAVLRNHWAKRHGARLEPVPVPPSPTSPVAAGQGDSNRRPPASDVGDRSQRRRQPS